MSHEEAFEQREESLPPSHRQWQAEEIAEQDIATMVEVYDVMTIVNHRLAEHRTQPLKRTIGDVLAWTSTVFLSISFLDTIQHHTDEGLIFPPILLAIWLYNRNLQKLDKTQAALSLQEYDTRWIGPLFDALSWPNRRIRQIVRLKLMSLLPYMTDRDVPYLSQKQRQTIYSILQETKDTALQTAILKAIPLFGDSTALAILEKLATTRAWTPNASHVRRAALVAMPLLREHVRRQAELTPQHLSPLSISTATTSTGAPQPQSVIDCAASTTTMFGEEKSALAKLEEEREKVSRPAMRMGFLIADWCIIVPFGVYQTVECLTTHHFLASGFWVGFTAAASQLYRVSLSSKRVAMIRKQAQQRDIKGVGALAEALGWPDQNIQYEAGSALTVLLPQLKANHATLLNASQRDCLHQVLKLQNAFTHGDLIVAILLAFQQVGDNAAIPYVEQLAHAAPRSPQEKRIVLAAQECLPYLQICANNNTASHSLLRASSAGDAAAADNLLRPSWENPETRPEQLLRPGDLEG